MNYSDIPRFPHFAYQINVQWNYLEQHLKSWSELGEGALILDPDFQRAHVWTEDQQRAYIEYMLQGGEVGKNITFVTISDKSWDWGDTLYLVDGKQRIESVRKFLRNEIKVFGYFKNEFEGALRMYTDFIFRVCNLKTRAEMLQLYLNINAGGTPHTKGEIEKVRELLEAEITGK
jgi:hypothetical protein